MADYSGEYGHPYPRVDQYGNPVPPVDQYGNPIPRKSPDQPTQYGSGAIGTAPPYGSTGYVAAVAPGVYGTASAVSGVVSPDGAAYTQEVPMTGGDFVAPGARTTYAYEGMVGSGVGAAGDQIQPAREEHTTLGERLRRSGGSGSSSSSSEEEEDDGQGGRGRRRKSIKEKIKEKLPGSHKQHEEEGHAAGTGTHAAGPHEKGGILGKIKEKLPGHHH